MQQQSQAVCEWTDRNVVVLERSDTVWQAQLIVMCFAQILRVPE